MANYYASTSGTSGGAGTIGSPWDLQTALNNVNQTVGDFLWLRGGTYTGKFTSSLQGGTVLPYCYALDGGYLGNPSERAKIDGYATTTLNGSITSGATSLTLTDASKVLVGGVQEIWIDNEVITCYAKTGNTITSLDRNAEGTVGGAAAHSNGATVILVGSPQFLIAGNNTTYQGLEICTSLPNRVTIWGKMRGTGLANYVGNGNSIINCVIHDNVTGLFTGSSSSNTLVYGNLIYNNGMKTMAPYYGGEARGGNLYLENYSGYSRLYEVLSINGFTYNGQLFGVSGPYVGGDVQGSVFANSGGPIENVSPYMPNLYIGTGSQQAPYASVDSTYIWHHTNANAGNLTMGYSAGVVSGDVTNSIMVGSLNGLDFRPEDAGICTGNTFSNTDTNARFISIQNANIDSYTFDNNTYYNSQAAVEYRWIVQGSGQPGTWNAWRSYTGYDTNSTLSSGAMPDTVIVRPNAYEIGRAHIIVFTASSPTSINVDLATTGLVDGQYYEIWNAFDFFGTTVATGTYDAGSTVISLPLNTAAEDVAEPTGLGYTPTTTVPNFAAFVVLPSSILSPSASTTASGNVTFSNAILR